MDLQRFTPQGGLEWEGRSPRGWWKPCRAAWPSWAGTEVFLEEVVLCWVLKGRQGAPPPPPPHQEAFPDLPMQRYRAFPFAQHPASSATWNLLRSAWYWLFIWGPRMCTGPAVPRCLVRSPVLAWWVLRGSEVWLGLRLYRWANWDAGEVPCPRSPCQAVSALIRIRFGPYLATFVLHVKGLYT